MKSKEWVDILREVKVINCISIHHKYISYKIFKEIAFIDEYEFYDTYPNPEDKLVVQTSTRLDIYFYNDRELYDLINFLKKRYFYRDIPYSYYKDRDAVFYLLKCLCRIQSRTLSESYLDEIIKYNYKRFENFFSKEFRKIFLRCFDIALKYRLKNNVKYEIYEKIKDKIYNKKVLIHGLSRTALYIAKYLPKRNLFIYHRDRRLLNILYGEDFSECFIDDIKKVRDIDVYICATLASHERMNEDFFKDFKKKVYVIDISPFGNFRLKSGEYVEYDTEIRKIVEENYQNEIKEASLIEKILKEISYRIPYF